MSLLASRHRVSTSADLAASVRPACVADLSQGFDCRHPAAFVPGMQVANQARHRFSGTELAKVASGRT
jgi:hypothetical protein